MRLRNSLALLAMLIPGFLPAEVTVPAIFADHAVLRRADKVPVWGKAAPGEVVTVTLAEATATTTAAADGTWSVTLDLTKIPSTPQDLRIAGRSNTLLLHDILIGEVWLASGQSNMAFGLAGEKSAKTEIPASANPRLRLFKVAQKGSPVPLAEVTGTWEVASPESSGAFSAVGYYFGKRLQQNLDVPVGMICSAYGGSVVQAWTSGEALGTVPDLKATAEAQWAKIAGYPQELARFPGEMQAWLRSAQREDPGFAGEATFAGTDVPTADWTNIRLPGAVAAKGLPKTGVVWLRREFTVRDPQDWPVIKVAIDGYFSLYLNGVKGREVSVAHPEGLGEAMNLTRKDWGSAVLKPGRNVLAIRLFQPSAPTRIHGVLTAGDVPLSGPWQAKAETAFPDPSAAVLAKLPKQLTAPPVERETSSALYNGMIRPLMPYALSGVIWYQGESNKNFAWQYRTAFPLLITSWRREWGQELPFHFCQMHNHYPKAAQPGDNEGAELREAQTLALKLPATGMAVTLDLGEEDIHPKNKKDVGERLAAVALVRTYGKTMPCSGPVFAGTKPNGSRLIVAFTHTDGGLEARPVAETQVISGTKTAPLVRNSPGSQLEGFAICGQDRNWVWAQARIVGDTVEVWADPVAAPVAVRYAWAINPTCNLYNGSGLPAAPFRSDDFPAKTLNARFAAGVQE